MKSQDEKRAAQYFVQEPAVYTPAGLCGEVRAKVNGLEERAAHADV